MSGLLFSYKSGGYAEVREALLSLEGEDSESEAIDVADEFVSRSIRNLTRIYEALVSVGYDFENPTESLVVSSSVDDQSVADFEARMGRIPTLAKRWYLRIKSVDFTQTFDQMTDSQSPLAGLGWNTPFIFQSLGKALSHWEHHQSGCDEFCEEVDANSISRELLTGGCASNNDCKGLQLPSNGFDEVLYDEGFGPHYFGDEISRGFLHKGFPVLTASKETLKFVRSLYGETNIDYVNQKLPCDLERV